MKHINWLHRKEEEMPTNGNARILYYDIETAPMMAAVWELYQKHGGSVAVWTEADWYILSFAYRWDDEKSIRCVTLPDFPLYEKEPENDLEVVKKLHELFSEADIVIAHNGDQFDQPKANVRFVFHKMDPPPPLRSVDTLKVARRYFKFSSNRLEDLCRMFGIGVKYPKHDYHLWQDCMRGDLQAWKRMRAYNKQDVRLLVSLYKRLRPWMQGHPRINTESVKACPKCGEKRLQRRGYALTKTMTYRRFQCQNCGGWCRERLPDKFAEKPLVTD